MSPDIEQEPLVHVVRHRLEGRNLGQDLVSARRRERVIGLPGPVDGDDGGTGLERLPGALHQLNQLPDIEVVTDLAEHQEVKGPRRPVVRDRPPLDTDVGKGGDATASHRHGRRHVVDRQEPLTSGRQALGECADRTAGLEARPVPLRWQAGHGQGVLTSLVPPRGHTPRILIGLVEPLEVLGRSAGHAT
jgi:hypothetical protein